MPSTPSVMLSSPTRAHHRQSVIITALVAPVQPRTYLSGIGAVAEWVSKSAVNPALGEAVEDLAIYLPPRVGYPAEPIRRCLQLAPRIDTLVLMLPQTTPASIFHRVTFPKLTVFSTNLPHRVVVSFLAAHSTISGLILETCGRSDSCPLRGLELRRLTSLQCPSRCFTGLMHDSLDVATINLTRLASLSSLALVVAPQTRLQSLTVDFFPNDCDILTRIAAAAPNLRKLKLNEKPRPQRRLQNIRRPWNDLQDWHRTLLRLPHLEELMLRTLLRISGGSQRSDIAVILGWADGVTRRTTAHPSLYHIALIQKDSDGVQQVLSHWFKRSAGIWERVSSRMVGPTHSFTM